jgi:hypothetical protein
LRFLLFINIVFAIVFLNASVHFGQNATLSNRELDRDTIEYASQLFREGRLKESRSVLNELRRTDQITDDGYLMLAYIEFWDGYPSRAKNLLNRIHADYHDIVGVEYLRNEIENQQIGQINIAYINKSDNQPLHSEQIRIGASVYRNKYIHPVLDATYYSFDTAIETVNSIRLMANNTFRTGLTGHSLGVSMGLYADNSFDIIELIGSIKYTHRFTGKLYSDVEFTKEPYLYHYQNVAAPFFTYQFISGLRYYSDNRYYSELKYQRWLYEDENYQDILSIYFVQNTLKKTGTNLYIGYAFSYSNANQSRYVIDQPESINTNTTLVKGVYFPYYTPNQDMAHSILLSIESDIKKTISANLALKYGVYAFARQPYYYVEMNNPSTIIFETYNFEHHPFEISGGADFLLSRSLSIHARYEYKRLKYYTTNDLFLTLRVFI